MSKIWTEFINYGVEAFKAKAYGRYYVLSWTPVKSAHNPNRCQVAYRRWRSGDSYPTLNVPKSDIIITRPMGKEPVMTTVAEQVNIAEAYEATIVTPDAISNKVGKVGGIAIIPLVVLGALFMLLLYFWMGRRR